VPPSKKEKEKENLIMKNTILADATNRLLKYKETSPHIFLLQNQLSCHNSKKAHRAVELQGTIHVIWYLNKQTGNAKHFKHTT
jgi:hypothetical protein